MSARWAGSSHAPAGPPSPAAAVQVRTPGGHHAAHKAPVLLMPRGSSWWLARQACWPGGGQAAGKPLLHATCPALTKAWGQQHTQHTPECRTQSLSEIRHAREMRFCNTDLTAAAHSAMGIRCPCSMLPALLAQLLFCCLAKHGHVCCLRGRWRHGAHAAGSGGRGMQAALPRPLPTNSPQFPYL